MKTFPGTRRAERSATPTIAVLIMLIAAACGLEETVSQELDSTPLSAEAYRDQITTIDRIVSSSAPLGEERQEELASTLRALSKRITQEGDTTFLRLQAIEIRSFADEVSRMNPDEPANVLRDRWHRLERNLFGE